MTNELDLQPEQGANTENEQKAEVCCRFARNKTEAIFAIIATVTLVINTIYIISQFVMNK
ncbi:MAG: hypothetical protein PHC64_03025 [Candidatus Gastranaerophilales bacterium]|nr:hypothetical protein [Candidatus Gastranaerophilales bacterium]